MENAEQPKDQVDHAWGGRGKNAVEMQKRELEAAFEELKRKHEEDKIAKEKAKNEVRVKSEWPGAGINSVMGPQCQQTSGSPYVFYKRVTNVDLNANGLRMSACLAAMDDCRNDLFTTCDMSVESFRKVNSPMVEAAIELHPILKTLGSDASSNGLLHKRQGTLLSSWLRAELSIGFPAFPMKAEEQIIYHVGKDRGTASIKEPICTARFMEAFTDKDEEKALTPEWEADFRKFWADAEEKHATTRLQERKLEVHYAASTVPFTPTHFKKVSWMMSHCYEDLWDIIYHGKVPEMLWEVNTKAGGNFAELVAERADPQAIAMNLPKMMQVGETYEVLCFLDAEIKKAVYVLAPEKKMKPLEVVLAVCASYRWDNLPQNGQTLVREDFSCINNPTRASLVNFGTDQDYKATKSVDLSKIV